MTWQINCSTSCRPLPLVTLPPSPVLKVENNFFAAQILAFPCCIGIWWPKIIDNGFPSKPTITVARWESRRWWQHCGGVFASPLRHNPDTLPLPLQLGCHRRFCLERWHFAHRCEQSAFNRGIRHFVHPVIGLSRQFRLPQPHNINSSVYFPAESPVICRKREESGKFYPGPDNSHHAAATSSGHFKSIQLSDPESENLNGSHASRCLLQLSAILGTVCVSASAFSFGPLFIYNSSRQSPLYIIACWKHPSTI